MLHAQGCEAGGGGLSRDTQTGPTPPIQLAVRARGIWAGSMRVPGRRGGSGLCGGGKRQKKRTKK